VILPCWQQHDLQLREVVQSLLHLVLPILELVVQQLVLELGSKRMPQLVGLQLAELLVAVQRAARQLVQIVQRAARQLVQIVKAHSLGQMSVKQQVQNFELVQILELGESHPWAHQLWVLWLLLELLNLVLLVNMF
jgi:hypothetical protein